MDNPIPPSSPPPPPPPFVPPPPIIMRPSPTPPRRSGSGWKVFALILLCLLFLSGLANLGLFSSSLSPGTGSHARLAGPRLDEAILEDNDAVNKIAVLDINGIISGEAIDQSGFTMVDLLKSQLLRAKEDDRVKAVILRVDSPGGEVLASDEMYRAISDFQKDSKKPVVASMGSLAASGGYYVSAPCRWIVANELTITGSIGVIMHGWNYRALMDKVGLRPDVYKSGKFKDMLSGDRKPDEIPPEERAMVQALIDETYSRFKEVVGEGRNEAHEKNKDTGKALASDWTNYADGRVLSGTQAFELGFVDQLGNFRDAVERAAAIANINSKALNLVKYQQRYDLSDFFRIFGKTEAPAIKVDLGMDVPKIQAGRLYFLSPTFLH